MGFRRFNLFLMSAHVACWSATSLTDSLKYNLVHENWRRPAHFDHNLLIKYPRMHLEFESTLVLRLVQKMYI